MSYEIRKNSLGQEVIEKITLRLKGCKYAATSAVHGGYNDNSCRGFSPTCSTADSYDASVFREIVFCNSVLPAGEKYFGGLGKVKFTRPTISPGESVGARAKLSFDVEDFIDNDVNIVPYENRRSSKGTFWGKMRARHPHFSGVEVIYSYGFRDANTFDQPDWVHHYLYIDSSTPQKNGQSFSCQDSLSFIDEKKGVLPKSSIGQLATDLTNVGTSFTVSGGPDFEYGAMGDTVYIAIGKEDMLCEVTGAQSLDVTQRAISDTEMSSHSSGSTVQKIYREIDIHAIDLIVDAMTNYSEVPLSHIDDYSSAKAITANKVLSSVYIRKPTKTKVIIDQAIKLAKLKCYSDTKQKKIVIKADDETDIQPIILNDDDHIIGGSLSLKTNEDRQETHFMHRWAKFPTDDDYKVNFSPINDSLMLPQNLGVANEGKEFKNILLGTSSGDMLIGAAYSASRNEKNNKIPEYATFKIPAKFIGTVDGGVVDLGSIISLSIMYKQDIDGNLLAPLYEIINIQGGVHDHFSVTARLYQSAVINSGDVDFTIDTNKVNYDLSTEFAPALPGNYVIYIAPNVIIGSDDTAIPAFDTGSQAAGVTLTIINRGTWAGMGGAGGNGRHSGGLQESENGFDAGDAFNMTVATTIDNGAGLILAGGGGAAGQDSGASPPYDGFGGGGGQGFGESLGGKSGRMDGSYNTPGNMAGPGGFFSGSIWSTVGGEFGESGTDTYSSLTGVTRLGGNPGIAIKTNGNALTISSGNNNINIKGAIV